MTATDRFVAGLGLILTSAIIGGWVALTKICPEPDCESFNGGRVCAMANFVSCTRSAQRGIIGAAIFFGTILAVLFWIRYSRASDSS